MLKTCAKICFHVQPSVMQRLQLRGWEGIRHGCHSANTRKSPILPTEDLVQMNRPLSLSPGMGWEFPSILTATQKCLPGQDKRPPSPASSEQEVKLLLLLSNFPRRISRNSPHTKTALQKIVIP